MENDAKILLLGKTKAGKSSFINYFLGKDVAKAGAGKPLTPDYFIPYQIADGRFPITIFDTKGLEALDANQQLDEIINGIKKRNNSEDISNWFHTIFYCVSMTEKFQDFEASFIRRLQKELTQHVHIIITHCDAATPGVIAKMRHYIAEKLDSTESIEIFEVVSVHKKKLNGQVVVPRGKELIIERVFDLLSKDIAYKLSFEYASALWDGWDSIVKQISHDFNKFVDETVHLGTLFEFILDGDKAEKRIEWRLEEMFGQLEKKMEDTQRRTDEQFTAILRPAAQLYVSYRGITTNSYVERADLSFLDTFEWLDSDWLDEMSDGTYFARKALPGLGRYMNDDGDIPDTDDLFEILGMIGAGVGDMFCLNANLKKVMNEFCWKLMHETVPSKEEIQAKSYERIVKLIKSSTSLMT